VTDPRQGHEEDGDGAAASLDALLSDPLVWEEPPAELEDAVLAAIADEVAASPAPVVAPAAAPGVADLSARRGRRWVQPFLAGAAAAAVAAVVLVVGVGVLDDDSTTGREGGTEVALAGTDLAPDASADALVADTPLGTVVDLDVTGLDPAPEGTYYEAWLRQEGDDGNAVSAGTFHLRGGDGEIALWAGVAPEQYPLLTVTLQEEGAGAESSGQVVLRGRVDR
jgi:hypothetical protein